jgi:hypothetical protein
MSLTQVLSQFEIDGRLGGVAFDRAYLRRALSKVERQRSAAFWIAISVQVVVFAIITAFVTSHAGDAKVMAYVLPAAGGGLTAAGWAAVRFWKEKIAADILVALVSSMDEEAAKTALGVVLDTFRQNATSATNRQRPIPKK